jgi:adenylate cyclase
MRRAPQAPEEHRRELVDPKIKEQHGRIVKTTGDGLLVEFRASSMRCGARSRCNGRCSTRNAEIAEDNRIAFRIGVISASR